MTSEMLAAWLESILYQAKTVDQATLRALLGVVAHLRGVR